MTRALIGFGTVRHARHAPRPHAFAYPTWFLLLPMRHWSTDASAGPPRNRRAWCAFHDADHGDGGVDALAWLDALLQRHGIGDADGEVWLQTFPRVLGIVFKPVSFWYAHRGDGSLTAIVAEVNNTFGERHCYVLHGPSLGWGRTMSADKAFHVSPFLPTQGHYRFRFLQRGDERIVARVELHTDDGPLLTTSLEGRLQPWSAAARWRALRTMPLLTLGIVARIHWQAVQLWCRRMPFFPHPTQGPGAPP